MALQEVLKCYACGSELGQSNYYHHGDRFCSVTCWNKVYGYRLKK